MATRAALDASIDAFWKAAGSTRPTTPQDLFKRQAHAGTSAGCAARPSARAPRLAPGRPAVAEAEAELSTAPEYQNITVELAGREGYNAVALNGLWRFWRVRNGRLAFWRDAEFRLQGDEVQAIASGANDACGIEDGERAAVATVRLFLLYMPRVDSWIVSDAPDCTGSVAADCGPVGDGEDLEQPWRVWDGSSTWREDRNVTAAVSFGGASPAGLRGLRVLGAASGASDASKKTGPVPKLGSHQAPKVPSGTDALSRVISALRKSK